MANVMANFKNKVYSNINKGTGTKDTQGYWYHTRQLKAQDKLIKEWLVTFKNKPKI